MALTYQDKESGLRVTFDREANIEKAVLVVNEVLGLEIDLTSYFLKIENKVRILPAAALTVDLMNWQFLLNRWFQEAQAAEKAAG